MTLKCACVLRFGYLLTHFLVYYDADAATWQLSWRLVVTMDPIVRELQEAFRSASNFSRKLNIRFMAQKERREHNLCRTFCKERHERGCHPGLDRKLDLKPRCMVTVFVVSKVMLDVFTVFYCGLTIGRCIVISRAMARSLEFRPCRRSRRKQECDRLYNESKFGRQSRHLHSSPWLSEYRPG